MLTPPSQAGHDGVAGKGREMFDILENLPVFQIFESLLNQMSLST